MKIDQQIKALFLQLTIEEQNKLLEELPKSQSYYHEIEVPRVIKCCVHCQSEKIIKHSMYKSTQRYKCNSCKRTFLPITGTLTYQIKKPNQFALYASIVEKEGLLTIAKMAERVGISIPTSFEWRHKILLSLPKKKINSQKKHKWTTYGFCTAKKVEKVWIMLEKEEEANVEGTIIFK